MQEPSSVEVSRPDVVKFKRDDPEVVKAVALARSKLDYFIKDFEANKKDSQVEHLVKFPLQTGPNLEHIWAFVYDYDKVSGFEGQLTNEPLDTQKYKFGDKLRIPRADVEDWLIRRENGFEGGFTMD